MVMHQGANYMGGTANLLKRQTAHLEKEDNTGLAAAVRPAHLGLGGWKAQKRARTAARVLHGYGANEKDINLPWAKQEGKPVQIRDDVSFDGGSVITNDEGEKEDPMAVLRRFNAERDKIQASPLLRRIDKISPGSTAEVRKALLAQKDLAGTRLPPIFAPLPPKPPRPKTPPFDPDRFNRRKDEGRYQSKPTSTDLRSALKKDGQRREGYSHVEKGEGEGGERVRVAKDEFGFEPGARGAIEPEEGEGKQAVEEDANPDGGVQAEPIATPVAAARADSAELATVAVAAKSNESEPSPQRHSAGQHLHHTEFVHSSKPVPRPRPAPAPVMRLYDDDDDPFATALTAQPNAPPQPFRQKLETAHETAALPTHLPTVAGNEDPEAVARAAGDQPNELPRKSPTPPPAPSSSRTLPPPKRRWPASRQARLASSFGLADGSGLLAAVLEVEPEVQPLSVGDLLWPIEEEVESNKGRGAEGVWVVEEDVLLVEQGAEERGWEDVRPGVDGGLEMIAEEQEDDYVVSRHVGSGHHLVDIPQVSLAQLANDNPTSAPGDFGWDPTSYGTEPAYDLAEGEPVDPAAAATDDSDELAANATGAVRAARPLFLPSTSDDSSDPLGETHAQGLECEVAQTGSGRALFSEADFFEEDE